MMKCLNKETLTCYIDNELPQNQRDGVKTHLTTCPACRETLAEVEAQNKFLLEGLHLLTPAEIPEPAFIPTPAAAPHRRGPAARLLEALHTSIRVPLPAMAVMVLIIIALSTLLLLQNKKIERMKSPEYAIQQQATLFLMNDDRIQSVPIQEDKGGFTRIRKPKIFVAPNPRAARDNSAKAGAG